MKIKSKQSITKQIYSTICQKCKEQVGYYCDNPNKCKRLKTEINRPAMFTYIETIYPYEGGIK
jgi:hypothetical protein